MKDRRIPWSRTLKKNVWSLADPYAKKKLVRNYFGTNHGRRALLSYVVYPYVLPVASLSHTNVLESTLMGGVLSELGYDVDIVHYDSQRVLNYQAYDLILGFGNPLVNAFRSSDCRAATIGFFAGMHNYHQNLATLARVKQVHEARDQWLLGSGRFVESDWTSIAALADAVIVTGNEVTAASYRPYVSRPVHVVPATYHPVSDAQAIIAERNVDVVASTFLWFGGHGLVHKGLDLVLDAFTHTPELHLHVCAPLQQEPAFVACFDRELHSTPNITSHGFVPLDSPQFRDLLTRCAFVVYASCAEGGSSSVVTVAANGGLVPIVSKASAVDIGAFGIEIAALTSASVQAAIRTAAALPPSEIRRRTEASAQHYAVSNSPERFAGELKRLLAELVAGKNRAEPSQ